MQKVKIPTDFINTKTARYTLAIEGNIQLTSEQKIKESLDHINDILITRSQQSIANISRTRQNSKIFIIWHKFNKFQNKSNNW